MSLLVTLAGTNYTIPEVSDAWTASMTSFCQQITIAPFWQSPTVNPAQSGFLRLATGDSIGWRNAANTADVLLGKSSGDALQWAGNNITGNPFLEANTSAGQSIPNGTNTLIVFGTVITDTDSAYNSSTGRYTIPTGKGGRYYVQAFITWSSAGTGATFNAFQLIPFKNAVAQTYLENLELNPGTTFAANNSIQGSTIINCVPGDILDVRCFQNSSGAITLNTIGTNNRIVIHKLVS